ncbi:hypothetical protein PHG31p246 [Aeromonas phage 31]|uniref:Uncharacterized protein n=4 Tax=Biquartavirus TaxID=1912143 RepID=Q6U951_9CAUD|nr:hypothetical protein ST44RRORF251c [Aeromonas phage 44RR2.8t]YP_238975.1 hypothetical protein PHG31p246 [Aeromonas phage 31]APU00724.1 hypothetical protein [Aeromonas phage 44RR2.8t.2]APU01139.1 hypothetical protein [Aeromonas phage 31.2]APU02051.1 hypothetical protein [Aeromonas phage L9-6]APU02549.1 hypothetical protein [Aeromonas phage SW69-9]UYD59559.1 hypothetical protein JNMOADIG_00030 [Aeromonas phage avDM5]UYD60467.1 hypothetical protein NPHMPGLK_00132 [Aeromonas phage avDM2]
MSSPFTVEFYNDRNEKVDVRYGNHGWVSPSNIRYAENIINVVNGARFGEENKPVAEWFYFISSGRVYFKEDYDKMATIVGLIKTFDPYEFSMELKQ